MSICGTSKPTTATIKGQDLTTALVRFYYNYVR